MTTRDDIKVGSVVEIICGWTVALVKVTRMEAKDGVMTAYYEVNGMERVCR